MPALALNTRLIWHEILVEKNCITKLSIDQIPLLGFLMVYAYN